ncbi:hypothetical protein D9M71_504010 [compost metagenome]
MHADYGHAHHQGRPAPRQAHVGGVAAQAEGDPQGRAGSRHGDGQGEVEQAGIVVDARHHAHGVHAQVVHRADARAHGQGAACQLPERLLRLAHQPEGEARYQHRNHQRQQGQRQVVAQGNGQAEGEHADEVHRPDADAHGESATADPQQGAASLAAGHPPGQVQRRIGRQDGHQQGDENEGIVVAAGEHGGPLQAGNPTQNG